MAEFSNPVGWLAIGAAALVAVVAWKAPQIVEKVNEWVDATSVVWKNTEVYAPDRPLPKDPRTKEPVPESDAPHTELGTRQGTRGKYPQAREFDAQGKPVRDIDFTDHGRPQTHPNPHEHKWKPNKTGGTPNRSPEAEPLSGWRYEIGMDV